MNRYKIGVSKERRIVNEARSRGFIAFRSAASQSPIDVCIISIAEKKIAFIQSKAGYISNAAKKRIMEPMKELTGAFQVSFEVL